jgi:uncharacterized protein
LNFHLLAKPAGAACNLSCKYCFFLSKENLYGERESPLMNEATLDAYVRELLETSAGPEVQIAWQGGEPMLRGRDFFRRSVELANRYRKPHQRILHTLQTNGTLIDDEWAAFFKQHNYLVGLSIDGPRALHDAYRIDKNGEGSFDVVIRGWNCLQAHAVDTNILCTIHARNADYPLEVDRFFRDELKARYIQLIPIVERATADTIAAANQGWGGLKGKDRPLYKQEGDLVIDTLPSTRAARRGWPRRSQLAVARASYTFHPNTQVVLTNAGPIVISRPRYLRGCRMRCRQRPDGVGQIPTAIQVYRHTLQCDRGPGRRLNQRHGG